MQSIDFSTHGKEINAAYMGIVRGDSLITWAVFSPDASGSYAPKEQGNTEIDDFVEQFDPAKVEFGLIRVIPPGSDVSKILLLGWCPETSPLRQKISFATNFATVAKTLHGYHVQVTARDEDDLDTTDLLKKILDAAGARYLIQGVASKPKATKSPQPQVIKPSRPSAPAKPISAPAASKPAAPSKPAVSNDDGWDGAEEVVERDFSKKPLETVEPAWKPIGRVDIDAIRSGKPASLSVPQPAAVSSSTPAVVAPPRRTLPPMPKREVPLSKPAAPTLPKQVETEAEPKPVKTGTKPAPEPVSKPAPEPVSKPAFAPKPEPSIEDLDEEERAFREKRKIFDQPAPVEEAKPKPVVIKPTAKPVYGAARPGVKVPLPVPTGFSKSTPKSTGALENGKTPAQIWAEKRGKYDSSAVPEVVNKNDVDSVSEKFAETKIESVSAAPKPAPEPATEPASAPEPATEPASLPPRQLPPRQLPPREVPKPVEPEPEVEEQPEEPEETEEEPAPAPTPSLPERATISVPEPVAAPEPEPQLEPQAEAGADEGIVAIARFNYEAEEEDEINLEENERVIQIETVDENWWIGTNSKGERGQFAASYVELVDASQVPMPVQDTSDEIPEHTDKTAVALYDSEDPEENELAFKAGDVITDIYEYDEDWWYGTLNGQRGLIPANYVELQ